ncbi:MAG: hypothetical protein B6245_19735, partial [Desulfobacteraceae bacterium 4572_88]
MNFLNFNRRERRGGAEFFITSLIRLKRTEKDDSQIMFGNLRQNSALSVPSLCPLRLKKEIGEPCNLQKKIF